MTEIIVEQSAQVISVILDAAPVNTLTLAPYQALTEIFDAISVRTDVHCVVFSARARKHFAEVSTYRSSSQRSLSRTPHWQKSCGQPLKRFAIAPFPSSPP